jgi:hypothetical protein
VKRGRETFQLTDALHSNQRKLTSKMPKKKNGDREKSSENDTFVSLDKN